MLPINGKPLLSRLIDRFKKANVKKAIVVGGFKSEKIDVPNIELIENEQFQISGELASLSLATSRFSNDMIILYGDLIFRGYVLRGLIESNRELTVVVDSSKTTEKQKDDNDFAYCSMEDNRELWGQDVLLDFISETATKSERQCSGRWIGMIRINGDGKQWIESAIEDLQRQTNFAELDLGDLLNKIIRDGHPIRVIYIHGHWLNVNSLTELGQAGSFAIDDT